MGNRQPRVCKMTSSLQFFPPFFEGFSLLLKRTLAFSVSFSLIFSPVASSVAHAQIVPDGGDVHLGTPSGGIPVLNINAPSSGGVSHNKFQDFNVDPNGLIVNNLNLKSYNPNYTTSLSGQHVEFNYNFREGDAARVILNEVVSNNTTALNGYTEIYGHRADYIVANPNGITCAGCGFINTGRMSLITGSANMSGGEVDGFNIGAGELSVNGVGADSFGMYSPSSAELVSNAVRIAGEVYAGGDLSIYSGNDKFDYKGKSVSSSGASGASIAVDSAAIGGIHAQNIRVVATQNGFGVNFDGSLVAEAGDVEISADGNVAFKTVAAAKDFRARSVSGDIHAKASGDTYVQDMSFSAGRDFANDGNLSADRRIDILAGRDLTNNGEIVSTSEADMRAGNDFTNTGEIHSNAGLSIEAGRDLTNTSLIRAKDDLILSVGRDIMNGTSIANALASFIVSGRDLELEAARDLYNAGKINAGGSAAFDALNLNNYGQILANKDLDFKVGMDLINHRAAGILAGGDIFFHIARNLVNYKAEVYALGDIAFEGNEDLSPAASNPALSVALYDNPYIAPEGTIIVDPPVFEPLPEETEEEVDAKIELADGTVLILPHDAFPDDAAAGDSYVVEGYIFIIGEESVEEKDVENPAYAACTAANSCTNETPTIKEKVYTYTGTDVLTLKDKTEGADGERASLAYTFAAPEELAEEPEQEAPPTPSGMGDIPLIDGGGTFSDPALSGYNASILDGYEFNANTLGTLLNWAGRIEAGGNVEIAAAHLANRGFDVNTGSANANLAYNHIRSKACSGMQVCGWRELGRYYITQTNLNSVAAMIVAGADIIFNGRDVLNQSAVMSANGNMVLNAADRVSNQTYSEVRTMPIYMMRRRFKCSWKGCTYTNPTETWYYSKRIYSKQRATMLAGGDLKIKTASLFNDQSLDPLIGLGIGTSVPDEVKNVISVDLKLPEGNNGLFRVVPDGKYLVEVNVSFIDPNDFIGSDYFFSNLGDGVTQVDTTRIIGDPAYETRLVMDAIVKATQQHYLDNDGRIGSDLEQMRALYDAAIDASKDMDLKVGIALSADQIASLREDIIWYVEKDVAGQKVLVPELYLSQATLASIDANQGSKITGFEVGIEADYVSNYGTITAAEVLGIKAGELVNETNDREVARLHSDGLIDIDVEGKLSNLSADISGEATKIHAGELENRTKVLSEDRELSYSDGYEKYHVEEAAPTAEISGAAGLKIDVDGLLHNTGADLRSESGNIIIDAGAAIFDTIRLHNRREVYEEGGLGAAYSKEETDIYDTIRNVGSNIEAGGSLSLTTKGDATFAGANVNVGGDAILEVGGNMNILAVKDYDYSFHEESTSYAGGFYATNDIVEDSAEHLQGSKVSVTDGLTIVSGQNVNVAASDVAVGGDAGIYAGYKVGEDGALEKSGRGGSVNVMSENELATHYEKHETTNYLTDVVKAAATGGYSLIADAEAGCEGGHCSANVTLGEKTKDETYQETSTAVGSNIRAGGNLTVAADGDINVKGSNIIADSDAAFQATRNINITAAENTYKESASHEETSIKAGVSAGNSLVDAAYVVKALIEAEKAYEDAEHRLDELEAMRDETPPRATKQAVDDARDSRDIAKANLAMATLAAANAIIQAGTSSVLAGFYASAGLTLDTAETTENTAQTTSTASNIFAGEDVVFQAGNDMFQIGSNVVSNAGSILYGITNNLVFGASKNVFESSSSSEHSTANITVGTNGVGGGVGHDESKSSSKSTAYDYSTTTAENGSIIYNVGGDMDAAGYRALADTIDLKVEGDLNLESLQNTSKSDNSSWGANVGFGTEKGIGGSNSDGSGNRIWTDDVSSLVGRSEVSVDVGGNLNMVGSEISNKDEDGNDLGNLSIKAGSLSYMDLTDTDENHQSGFSMSVSGENFLGANDGFPKGKTKIGMTDTGDEKEQITRATIGSGTIEIANGSGTDINREVSRQQEVTKDLVTGALDANITIDNRIFTEEGRKSILEDLKNLPAGALGALENAWDIASNPIDAASKAAGAIGMVTKDAANMFGNMLATGNIIGAVQSTDAAIELKKVVQEMAQTEEGREQLAKLMGQDGDLGVIERDSIMGNLVSLLADAYGVDIGSVKTMVAEATEDGTITAGSYDTREGYNDIYLNELAITGDVETGLGVLGHETSHGLFGGSESTANMLGGLFTGALQDGLWMVGLDNSIGSWGTDYSGSTASYIAANTAAFSAVPESMRWNQEATLTGCALAGPGGCVAGGVVDAMILGTTATAAVAALYEIYKEANFSKNPEEESGSSSDEDKQSGDNGGNGGKEPENPCVKNPELCSSVTGAAAATGDKVEEATKITAAEISGLTNKIHHIFDKAEHGLQSLVEKYAGDLGQATKDMADKAANMASKMKLPDGLYDFKNPIVIQLKGELISVTGRIQNGVFQISDAAIKK